MASVLALGPTAHFCKEQPPCSAQPLLLQGGFEYKRAVVDCIINIIEENSESKETGLSPLCEFMEDCEFTELATHILHLLGQEGPKTKNSSKSSTSSITEWSWSTRRSRQGSSARRPIPRTGSAQAVSCQIHQVNHICVINTSAVSALAKLGVQNEELLPRIFVLLKRSNHVHSWSGEALQQYTLEPSEKPFDFRSVPLATMPMAEQRIALWSTPRCPITGVVGHYVSLLLPKAPPSQQPSSMRRWQPPGRRSSRFDCTSTLNDQTLENVTVQWSPLRPVRCSATCLPRAFSTTSLGPATTGGTAYRSPHSWSSSPAVPGDIVTTQSFFPAVACTFSCMMKFTVKDCDPTTGDTDDEGYEDEYVLEDLEVTVADHIQKVMKLNFEAAWDEVGKEFVREETFI
ncbi:hypothetical protein HPG69_012521 [Diceros bicornis minor]|uniref:Uncharacterized protein n=1 Tax=Diceros bicornis minor TaxID=77932 RepID=A0A7J7F8N5_DICBM|nr:hypothetical protein HPG69_012521 [Diceros bicornis minor]